MGALYRHTARRSQAARTGHHSGGPWCYSPPRKRPNHHALPCALPATAYLGIPTGAEFIKSLMHGILLAVRAKAAESFAFVVQQNFAAPGEVRLCRPNTERR